MKMPTVYLKDSFQGETVNTVGVIKKKTMLERSICGLDKRRMARIWQSFESGFMGIPVPPG